MNWQVERSDADAVISDPYFLYSDPAQVLSRWRKDKLARGLMRHPSTKVRVAGCQELLGHGTFSDAACWDALTETERGKLSSRSRFCCTAAQVAERRQTLERHSAQWWWDHSGREERRLGTAVSNRAMRTAFCRLYQREYPGDYDTGCPANQPPPATIVTEQGDIPLRGAWPR